MSYTGDSFVLPEVPMDDLLINPVTHKSWNNEATLNRVMGQEANPASSLAAPIHPSPSLPPIPMPTPSTRAPAREQEMRFDFRDPMTIHLLILVFLVLNFYLMFCVCLGIRKVAKKIKKYGVGSGMGSGVRVA